MSGLSFEVGKNSLHDAPLPASRVEASELKRPTPAEIHKLAKDKGWYDKERSIGDFIAMIHSELSEALECYRIEQMTTVLVHGKPEGFGAEIADVVIRVEDLCEHLGINLDLEIARKHKYNRTRAYRHGGKSL